MKDKFVRRVGRAREILFFVMLIAIASTRTQSQIQALLNCQPARLTNGSPILFQLSTPAQVRSVSGSFLGHTFDFFHGKTPRSWYALAGVPLLTSPGKYNLEISEFLAAGRTLSVEKQIKVFQASYPKITVQVPKQYTEPSKTQLAAIAVDKNQKETTFAGVSAQRLWSGPFTAPVSASVSDLFGTERVFNKEVQSRHQGLDFGVPAGTPVRAVNRGIVVLARPMFFEGNFVVIDHGQGLMSLYLHLSDFKVKEGELVRAGQIIALSGGTGRATGAHLHLAIRWQGVYLNPAILLKLPIPVT
jgi:murein DD-endopeptidase MepM/ murein hydrolase activator NlpD